MSCDFLHVCDGGTEVLSGRYLCSEASQHFVRSDAAAHFAAFYVPQRGLLVQLSDAAARMDQDACARRTNEMFRNASG